MPRFVKPPAPDITPENSVLLLSPPTDNVDDPRLIDPLPAIDPTASSAPTSYVPEPPTLIAVPSLKLPLTTTAPLVMAVDPE